MEANLFTAVLAIIFGLIFLVWGADRFVAGAAGIAANLGVSPLLIGLTIVGFGTSAPEILVSLVATLQHKPGIAVGNALGSNIANIALVLGTTAIFYPLTVSSNILRREYPVMFAIMLLGLLLIIDNELGRWDGIILLSGLLLMIVWVVRLGKQQHQKDPLQEEFSQEIVKHSIYWSLSWLLLGLLLLITSSRALVWGAVYIAQQSGMSELLIGLTIVAIGTSLPELATSITSAFKKEHDIAIGNILGSNMFNLLAVLGIPGLLSPHTLDNQVRNSDYPIMIMFSILLFVFAYGFKKDGRINRLEGFILLTGYFAYLSLLYYQASG